jgi:uncharacterized protein YydD (DUF2326 family)
MKLSRLYTNDNKRFEPIRFNGVTDQRLNVVFANITKPKDADKDSHNLGKTTLIHIIDFLLLKQVNQEHFFLKHAELFGPFVFFLEVQTHKGDYVTIRRSAQNHSKVSLKRHAEGNQDFTTANDSAWDHLDAPLNRAEQLLDGYLDLQAIKPWDYRKGVSYFLRTQEDYVDFFQIQKFAKGNDIDWKPYLAHIIGIDDTAVTKKYECEDRIDELKKQRSEKQAEVGIDEKDYTKLQNEIAIKEQELARAAALLDTFDFSEQERRITKDLIERIEQRTSEINNELYNINYDLDQMRQSLNVSVTFKIETVKQIFEETKTYIPDKLYSDYDELVDFNKRVTQERNKLLRRQIKELETQQATLDGEGARLNTERVQALALVRSANTFDKFKALQKEFAKQQGELNYLLQQRTRLAKVLELSKQLRELERDRDDAAATLKDAVDNPTKRQQEIAVEFSTLVRRVLDLEGFFFPRINTNGNIEFKIETRSRDNAAQVSSQSEGTSYKKLICALFDLAILRVYAKEPFYHFVYHDGILEALDFRKKRRILEVLRETSTKYNMQCIITAIDDDVPRDEDGQRTPFPDNEIILRLNDSGPSGRLFKTREF